MADMGYLLFRNAQKWAKNGFFGRFCPFQTWMGPVWVGTHPNHLGTFKYELRDPELPSNGHLEAETGHFCVAEWGQKPVFWLYWANSCMYDRGLVCKPCQYTYHLWLRVFWPLAGQIWPFRSWNWSFSSLREVRNAHFWVVWAHFSPGHIQLCLETV